MKIAVAGTGYVGLVAGVCFAEQGYDVTCVDVDEKKIEMMRQGISPIYEDGLEELMRKNNERGTLHYTTDYADAYRDADAIFIGVGTPEMPDGSANLNYIATVSRQIAESVEKDCLVVVKSTVPVGTNDKVEQFIRDFLVHDVKVEVASNPEFLAQGTAVHDTLHAARIIIGTESKEAEALLKLVGADITDVAKGMCYDERIGSRFLNAGIGYGGSCFPKDTKALKFLAREHGYQLRTVEACVAVNSDQKTRLFEKAKERMISFNRLKVAVLGLTFKAGTDDLREAPSIDNIRLLLAGGADIFAYDPKGEERAKLIFPEGNLDKGTMNYVSSPEEALDAANICFVFTEWGQVKELTPEMFREKMHTPLVYDGRNLYAPEAMKKAGVEYYSIGR